MSIVFITWFQFSCVECLKKSVGLFLLLIGSCAVFSRESDKVTITVDGLLIPYTFNGYSGLVDENGDIILRARFIGTASSEFCTPYGPCPVAENRLWGYIDRHGHKLIDFKFAHARPFSENKMSVVCVADSDFGDGIWAVIDSTGREFFRIHAENVDEFDQAGMARFRSRGRFGFVSDNGRIMIEATYVDADPFSDSGLAAVKDSAWGYIVTLS